MTEVGLRRGIPRLIALPYERRDRYSGQDADHQVLPTPSQINDCGWVANRWAEMLPLTVSIKQQLMTLDSPLLRLELVADVLEQMGIGGAESAGGPK